MIDGKVTISTQDYHEFLREREELEKFKRSLEKRVNIRIYNHGYCDFGLINLESDKDVPEYLQNYLNEYRNRFNLDFDRYMQLKNNIEKELSRIPNWIKYVYKLDKYDTRK